MQWHRFDIFCLGLLYGQHNIFGIFLGANDYPKTILKQLLTSKSLGRLNFSPVNSRLDNLSRPKMRIAFLSKSRATKYHRLMDSLSARGSTCLNADSPVQYLK